MMPYGNNQNKRNNGRKRNQENYNQDDFSNQNNEPKPQRFKIKPPILTDDYVDKAEQVIHSLKNSGTYKEGPNEGKIKFKLTSTQIRNLAALTSNLFDESKTRKDIEELREKISYLRIQFVYQSGREPAVEDFVKKAGLLEALKEIQDIPSLQRFCRYMEALIAYFKFNGGRDQ
ncbi:CRISPR-associated protein, Csm2 family [Streptococcus cristatus]|uniref:CRISPR system Cms protein Csm2 n=1 Tax=Streptococcus cristatus TaxID=45634 RepID=A0A139N088_STRCR|nr:type III-A CRISPR-associated protein Csm2 [Streptococcus cristatus]KXT69131.1 CRISPR-associated protein, Csm2 family [Streptococcus cristatus]